jgi:ATP:ADP antiporter, AAA family
MTRRSVHTPALLLFGIMLAHAMLETARDALFLAHLGPDQLAWAYLAIAGTALAAVTAVRRSRFASEPRTMLLAFLVVAAAGTTVLAFAIDIAPSVVFVLYVWTGLVATLLVPSFWMTLDRGMRLADAKRLFAMIGAGGVLGALVGSASAAALARVIAPEHLVTAAAIVFAVVALAATRLAPHATIEQAPPRPRRYDRAKASQRTRRYAALLLAGAVLATVTLTLGDLMFKRILAEQLATDDLASALGAIYTALNMLALVVQLAVTPRLLERLGVGGALFVLPALVLVTAFGFAATGAVLAVIALKLADGGFRHSVHRVAGEILFMPLEPSARDVAKPVIEAVGQRGGQAAAALLTLAIAAVTTRTCVLAILVVAMAALWLATMAMTRRAYVHQFRATLDANEIQREVRIATFDADGVAMLTASLSSPDETEALAALDLLARRGNKVPALVLYHPSSSVVRRALSLLDGDLRVDIQRVLGQLTSHADPQIRAAALAASSRTGCHPDQLNAALHDPEPQVRAAAIVGLATCEDASASPRLAAMVSGTVDERIALAQAIGRAPHARFRAVLDRLVATSEPSVLREVLAVWARAPELADVQRLLKLVEHPYVRGDARRVFVAAGPRFFDELLAAIDDPRTPLGVRRHLPRTISRFGDRRAAAALVSRLVREPDGMTEFKILRALGRMRADAPMLAIDPQPVRVYIRRAIEDAARYAQLADELAHAADSAGLEAGAVLLHELTLEKRDAAIERVFRAIGVLYPTSDLRSLHDAIQSRDDERHTAAREILEDLLPASTYAPLFAAIEPQPVAEPRSYEEVLASLLEDPSDSLRCVAAHHVAERRLVALRPQLARLRPTSRVVTQAFHQAIERLDA